MPDQEIARLIDGCRRGDRDSFSRIVDLYSSRLYGFYIHMGYKPDQAEDLVQELFVRLVEKLKKYSHTGKFEAWLFRVAANMARDFARKRSIKTVSLNIGEDDERNSHLEFADNKQPSPDSRLQQLEANVDLQSALFQLSDQERELVLLRHYSDMSFKDIASDCGLPVGTVLSKVHRALKKLKDIMS